MAGEAEIEAEGGEQQAEEEEGVKEVVERNEAAGGVILRDEAPDSEGEGEQQAGEKPHMGGGAETGALVGGGKFSGGRVSKSWRRRHIARQPKRNARAKAAAESQRMASWSGRWMESRGHGRYRLRGLGWVDWS